MNVDHRPRPPGPSEATAQSKMIDGVLGAVPAQAGQLAQPRAFPGSPPRATEPPGQDGELASLIRLAARIARTPLALIDTDRVQTAWADPALKLSQAQISRLFDLARQIEPAPAEAVVPDATQDPRLWHDPAVTGVPQVRFIALIPLVGSLGRSLGALCLMDPRPRARLGIDHAEALADVAGLAARLIERAEADAAQSRRADDGERLEQLEAAVGRAPTADVALAGLLIAMCKHHRASAGYVGRAVGDRTVHEVCHYNDQSRLGDYVARTASIPRTPDTSHAARAILANTAEIFVLAGPTASMQPSSMEATRAGLALELVQPLYLLDDTYGIVMLFDEVRPDRDAMADDLAAIVRHIRPALYRRVAEQRMRLLGTALDRANDAVVITEAGPLGGAGPRIVYTNASFCRESGYGHAEIIGQPHGFLHGPDTDPAAVARLRQEMRRWKPARAELLLYRRDGAPFWAEIDVTPITDETGMPTQWVAIQRDVTDRREHEAARLRHEASFRMLFEDNPLAMMVMKRESLAIIEVNDAAVAQYGWSREELLGRTLVELDPDRDEQHARALASGQLGAAASTTHMRDDGSVLEVRAMVHDTVHAGQDATLAVLWDVTDLEAARRDMHHANEMLRERTLQLHARTDELAEAQRLARLGTWRISADRQDVSWSREMYELMGVARDPVGLGPDALMQRVHEDDRETVRQALATAGRDRQARSFEYRVTLRDNQVRHLRAEVRPVFDERGDVVELFGYSQDISALKHAEQALLRNEQLRSLGQLTGGVAHDFNNLLTVVILNLEEALDIAPEGDEMQEILAPALHAAVRGAELTSQLLSYARRATLRPERVRPDEFFGALRPLLNRVLGERFELQVLLRHNGGSAMVDPAQLDSAIMNLVINARDAMPQGGPITLETRSVVLAPDSPGFQDEVTPGRYVVISVGDRGQGIPAEVLPRIFEPFFTTKAVGKGSGMGLSMVYGFARQSGGHVTVESTEGVGTTVRLFLPVAAEAEAEAIHVAAREEWSAQGLRALVVEDQESVLATVMRMLRQLGFDPVGVTSADAAAERLGRDGPFDLLFSDIVLPGTMDGVALAEFVRAQSPNTRILLTSGFTEHSLAAEDTVPDVEFLMKPYKRQDLQSKFSLMFPRS